MSRTKIKRPEKEELEELYLQEGSTISSVARYYGTTQPTVRGWLKSYDIPRKSHKQASTEANNRKRINSKPSKDKLEKLYKDSSIKSLEKYFGVGQSTIYNWLNDYEIPLKSLSGACEISKKKYFNDIQFDKDFLDEQYDRTKSINELADKLNVSRSHIRKQLIENGIEIVPIEPSYRSKAEIDLANFLMNEFPEDKWEICTKNLIAPYEIDILNHTKKIAIEYCGLYWHSENSRGRDKVYHKRKYDMCKNAGYLLFTIFESDDIEKVKKLLLKKLGKTRRIWARDTTFKFVDASVARDFHNKHHLHSSVGSKYHYGLFHEDEGLLMVGSFGENRFSKNRQYECTRITSHSDFSVVGGVSKLIKNFIRWKNPKSILTFADLRFGDGSVYNHCGFEYVEDTKPNYWYSYKYIPPLYSRVNFKNTS